MDWDSFSFSGPQVATAPSSNIDWEKFSFTGPAQQEVREPPLVPMYDASQANNPTNLAEKAWGQKGPQKPYPGMPLEKAWASDPISQGLGNALENSDVQTGFMVLGMHPELTAGSREAVLGLRALERPPQPIATSNAMPRASVREGDELLKTGGQRIEEAKLNPAKVSAEAIGGPMQNFRDATKTIAINDPVVKNVAKRLEKAYTPKKPDAMSRLTKIEPPERSPLTLTELHGHQQRLDNVINGAGKNPNGTLNEQGLAAIELKKAVSKIIDEHPESNIFKIGKHEYHRGKMNQSMEDIRAAAERRSQWRNGDEAGALQAEISRFLGNRKNRYALTPDARRKLAILSQDKSGRLLGAFGAKNIGGFTFARGVESMFGVPGILAAPGHFARQDRNDRIIKEFEKIMAEIRAGGSVKY